MAEKKPVVRWWVLLAVCAGSVVGIGQAEESARPPLVTIAWIRDLDGSDPGVFGTLVRVRGTVTWRGERGLVVEDDSAAVWVSVRQARRTGEWRGSDETFGRLQPGVEVEIDGTTQRAGYSPSLHPVDIRITGRRPLPPAPDFDPDLFFTGFEEVRRIAADVVVQAVRDDVTQWRFIVEHHGRQFTADVEKDRFRSDPEDLIDAEVRIGSGRRAVQPAR